MAEEVVTVPDIGAEKAEVIELLVAVGDNLERDQSLVVLESDKASVEVPCPWEGQISSVLVAEGDEVSEGDALVKVQCAEVDEAITKGPEVPISVDLAGESAKSSDTSCTEPAQRCYQVPDIGSDEADVIELSVAVGDRVESGDTILVAESEKASLEIPAEASGTVLVLHVREGQHIRPGQDLVTIATSAAESTVLPVKGTPETAPEPVPDDRPSPTGDAAVAEPAQRCYQVPDIGSDEADVIELSVAVGDRVESGDTILVAESEKASLEIPAEASGTVLVLHVREGQHIRPGQDLVTIATSAAESTVLPAKGTPETAPEPVPDDRPSPTGDAAVAQHDTGSSRPAGLGTPSDSGTFKKVHAGPAVRKLARQLGVDLAEVRPSGPRERILKEDVHVYVKKRLHGGSPSREGGGSIPEVPGVDWGRFGEVESSQASRIQRATAANVSTAWLNVPHVTQFDDADVTAAENLRSQLKPEGETRGIKITPLAFVLRACGRALLENPRLNTALHNNGLELITRQYVHIGIAVDTPAGLLVPVVRNVDRKDTWQLAAEITELATKAREGILKPADMQGAGFTVSSLGAIGGTGFTPIVVAPQAGILGVSGTLIRPVWDGNSFVPRKLMPLSLSYDHRLVNGADAGKFLTRVVSALGDADNLLAADS